MRHWVEEQSSRRDRTRQSLHWFADLGLDTWTTHFHQYLCQPGVESMRHWVEEQSSRRDRTRQSSHWFVDLGLNP